jgi:hypothetical protein
MVVCQTAGAGRHAAYDAANDPKDESDDVAAESLTKVFREMVQQHREYHTDPAPRSSKRTSNK